MADLNIRCAFGAALVTMCMSTAYAGHCDSWTHTFKEVQVKSDYNEIVSTWLDKAAECVDKTGDGCSVTEGLECTAALAASEAILGPVGCVIGLEYTSDELIACAQTIGELACAAVGE